MTGREVIASPALSGRGNLIGPTKIASALSCLAMTGWVCHCEPFPFVIASPDLSGRGNLIGPAEIASALSCLAMTEGGCCISVAMTGWVCHCEPRFVGARQSHSSSYKSRHSLFILLINWTFFCLEPAFICFSLRMAFSISSKTS